MLWKPCCFLVISQGREEISKVIYDPIYGDFSVDNNNLVESVSVNHA